MTDLIQTNEPVVAEKLPNDSEQIVLGDWYWVDYDGEERLGCVSHMGSNYVAFMLFSEGRHRREVCRLHVDELDTVRPESDPDGVIQGNVDRYRKIAAAKMGKVKEITARLGTTAKAEIESPNASSTALAAVSSQEDVDDYKEALVRAKETTLPELFEEIEEAHQKMAAWMQAPAMAAKVQAEHMKGAIAQIEDQIFTVDLYAGLSEQIVQVVDGQPAASDAKIHVMQRRHYMDEECLANYRHGGMDYQQIEDFDAWLSEPENMDRILPFPRTVVAFRVRRTKKDRSEMMLGSNPFVRILSQWRAQEADKQTFLYIRNGENLYRLICEHDFGEKLFPERALFQSRKLWWYRNLGRPGHFITDAEYQERKATCERLEPKLKELQKKCEVAKAKVDNKEHDAECKAEEQELNRLTHEKMCVRDELHSNRVGGYRQFVPDDVYYDDMNAEIQAMMKRYNRAAFILQGLLDRSVVFHPHPPVRLWTPDGMDMAIELVRDDDYVLNAGEKPDIEAYLEENRRHLKAGCHTIGQQDFWERREAEKENKRDKGRWRSHPTELVHFRPYGNPGPGYIAEVLRMMPRAKKCTYEWTRERLTSGFDSRGRWRGIGDDPIPTKITVPPEKLFVVEAYKPGDYKQFFADPRTRAEYLKWASLMLAAEEWHAGNMVAGHASARASFC